MRMKIVTSFDPHDYQQLLLAKLNKMKLPELVRRIRRISTRARPTSRRSESNERRRAAQAEPQRDPRSVDDH
jgi:hypothetical protein